MKRRKKAAKTFVATKAVAVVAAPSPKLPVLRFCLATLAVVLFSAMGAIATNIIHHGHVAVTHERTEANAGDHPQAKQAASRKNSKSATVSSKVNPEFIAKYGLAAKSQQVAAEIMKIETAPGPTFSAVQAADAAEAIRHGFWRTGASSMDAILAGYVPPGMAPEQAAMLYNALPRNARAPVMQEAMTPERIARMAGEPADPMGLSQTQIQIHNEQIARSAISERFGPIYVPPLQRNHQGSIREMTDDSGNIVAQYAYDPYGSTSKVQGTTDSDFGYAGYYVHKPSGLSLTQHRAYSPVLGRFINRDPIGEIGGTNLYAYVDNNPIGHRDPSGLFQWYGNWGGPQWTNGTDTWSESASNFPYLPGQTGYVPPVNQRDACYFCHDVCLHNTSTVQHDTNRQRCRGDCDTKLAACLRRVRTSTGGVLGNTTAEEGLFSSRLNQFVQAPYRPSIIPYPITGGLCGD